ncbi:MAG: TetR family transcriptional regulator [Acidimicrobiales bacterium]|nr:TetR family transcriptional regulator [Acidimicrobiales bacterium]
MPRRRAEGVATRAEQATATREALIDAARRLWADKGFFATSTAEIVEAAGAGTRGALYHHFADREELFLAVFDAVQEELTTSMAPTKIDEVDPISRVRRVLLVFLDLVAERPDAQALLIDGPAVFGWRRWRELESQRGLAAIENLLEAAVQADQIAAHLVQPLAALLLGLMTDAALLVATSEDPARARASTADAFAKLLDGLRTPLPG